MTTFDQEVTNISAQAWAVMEDIGRRTGTKEAGITRPCCGEGEQLAHNARLTGFLKTASSYPWNMRWT